jgi:hypothetical protein
MLESRVIRAVMAGCAVDNTVAESLTSFNFETSVCSNTSAPEPRKLVEQPLFIPHAGLKPAGPPCPVLPQVPVQRVFKLSSVKPT